VSRHSSPPFPCSDGQVTKHLQKYGTGKLEHRRASHEVSFTTKQTQNNAVIFAVTHSGLRGEVSCRKGELGVSDLVKYSEA